MRKSVESVAELLAGQYDHFVRNVDAVDFREMAAHGPHEPAGSAADFERLAVERLPGRNAAEFGFQAADHLRRGCEESRIVLPAPPEGDVVACVFPRARVP